MAVVLITGCSSGFGLLSAVAFARRGDRVFASMRDVTKAGTLREAAAKAGVEVEIVELDVSDDSSVRRAVDQVIATAGQIGRASCRERGGVWGGGAHGTA